MNEQRRAWVLGAGVALAAAAAGLGWGLWRRQSTTLDGDAELWSLSLDTPGGERLAMADQRGHRLVLNFWAPWCPPCVREMPALERFQRDFGPRGWRVIGLAADQPGPVREFLSHTPVTFAVGLAGVAAIDLSRRLGNVSGGLPFTLLFDSAGRLVQRRIGETTYDQLAEWAAHIG